MGTMDGKIGRPARKVGRKIHPVLFKGRVGLPLAPKPVQKN